MKKILILVTLLGLQTTLYGAESDMQSEVVKDITKVLVKHYSYTTSRDSIFSRENPLEIEYDTIKVELDPSETKAQVAFTATRRRDGTKHTISCETNLNYRTNLTADATFVIEFFPDFEKCMIKNEKLALWTTLDVYSNFPHTLEVNKYIPEEKWFTVRTENDNNINIETLPKQLENSTEEPQPKGVRFTDDDMDRFGAIPA